MRTQSPRPVAVASEAPSADTAAAGEATASEQTPQTSEEDASEQVVYKVEYDEASSSYYYLNTETGESSWDPPVPSSTRKIRVAAYESNFDNEGNLYWLHADTGESSWELPPPEALVGGATASENSTDGADATYSDPAVDSSGLGLTVSADAWPGAQLSARPDNAASGGGGGYSIEL